MFEDVIIFPICGAFPCKFLNLATLSGFVEQLILAKLNEIVAADSKTTFIFDYLAKLSFMFFVIQTEAEHRRQDSRSR